MSNVRFSALSKAWEHQPEPVKVPSIHTKAFYAQGVFTREKMKEFIPDTTLNQFIDAIEGGKPLGRDIASSVAIGMKKWAIEQGATHYAHWFQPLTGGTAEKHDSFLGFDDMGGVMDDFSGSVLYQQEPDASSFPSGGIRNTFEARGYTAWDPTSPVFVIGDTLCIPSIFIAYTGEALDYKTPLLRSTAALNKAAVDVARLFDRNVQSVVSYLGWEQEYFLVDDSIWSARPDLVQTGRTLMGHASAKSQQLDDHYFGTIPERVLEFMRDLEVEALKLGIPVKTRHNEVAPNQFELAPIYEECNLANDHNLLIMSVMEKTARRHHFRVLLHEKPFAGVNGSGKHCNWSMGTNTGVNLLGPGKTPYSNLQFITFLVNVLMAVKNHGALLKATIASATNAFRLGANEAPPAIISVFLGKQISEVLEKLENASADEGIIINAKKEMKLGVGNIPEILLDNTDRNRTSPFAFTGNRFEFRAVGSSANCGAAMLALNAAVAEQLMAFKQEVDALMADEMPKEKALFEVIRRYIRESRAIVFDGNGYGKEWHEEAKRRGLDTEVSVPLMIDQYLSESSIRMFETTKVMTEAELRSRCEVKWETYSSKVQIEARVLGDLILNHIVPASNTYEGLLLENLMRIRAVYGDTHPELVEKLSAQDTKIVQRLVEHADTITELYDKIKATRYEVQEIVDAREKAIGFHDRVAPLMEEIRAHVDALEIMVDDKLWPLPKYRELLFIR